MDVPISDRARRWGYLIWPHAMDAEMHTLLGDAASVAVRFGEAELGSKTVDWMRRRISLGPRRTRAIPDPASTFVLEHDTGTLRITYR